jgi:hypothetical protein
MTNSAGYPAINSTNTTGGFTGVNGLQLFVSSSAAVGNYLRTTVSFATPVAGLSFQVWDVDASPGQFVDKLSNIQALAEDGSTVGATSVSSAVSGFNTISGTGLSTVVVGTAPANNSTNEGTINISFAGPITRFSFDWSNADAGRGQQAIGLGPLTYTPVPESVSTLTVTGFCLWLIIFEALRRQRRPHEVALSSRHK